MEDRQLLQPEKLEAVVVIAEKVLAELDRILLGRHQLHRQVMAAILARGHVLLEGLPGLGKTALVKVLGGILSLDFSRVQFTPDLMPSDIVGAHILQDNEAGVREMVFRPGPVFTNILLADEINRASPKTQSALLEAMQEHAVTLLGTTRALPQPFFVLASQNPIDLEGTYPLPEAQLDRFLFKLHVGGLDVDVVSEIIATRHRGETPQPKFHLSAEDLHRLFDTVDRIFIPKPVGRYIARLVAATHPGGVETPEEMNRYVSFGASPRAAIAIAEAARATALLRRSPTVGFEDVAAMAVPALNHRILLNYQARLDGRDTTSLVEELLHKLDESGISLTDGVKLGS